MRADADAAALRGALDAARREAAAQEAAAQQAHRQLVELQHRTALRPQQASALAEVRSLRWRLRLDVSSNLATQQVPCSWLNFAIFASTCIHSAYFQFRQRTDCLVVLAGLSLDVLSDGQSDSA